MQKLLELADFRIVKYRAIYENALGDLDVYHPQYLEDMTSVFNKCQDRDMVKLQLFESFFLSLHQTLDLTQDPKYSQYNRISFYSRKKKFNLSHYFSLAL